jgi:hypothetical protein
MMIIVNRKAFALGSLLSITFLGVLALIFAPVFGGGMNGLQYADDMFNRLSKGSSYFIPKVAKASAGLVGTPFRLDLQLDSAVTAEHASTVLVAGGVAVDRSGNVLKVSGDLGRTLAVALRDAEEGYRNDSSALLQRYGLPAQTALATWWQVLRQMDKVLKQERRLAEAKVVHEVMKKAIEPAHNYFGIEALRVTQMAGTMTALLVFYVIYTMWWGYAIFYLFEGIGLVMKKRPAANHG